MTDRRQPWVAPPAHRELAGRLRVPGSKSESARALVLAAISDGPSTVTGLLTCRDTDLMRAGLGAFGVSVVDEREGVVHVHPPQHWRSGATVDCGLAGTVMRFLPALAATVEGTTTFTGDEPARRRPLSGLVDALAQLGAAADGDRLPLTLTAPSRLGGPRVEVDASASSQFVSALLLAAPRMPEGLDLHHVGHTLPSAPHIEMTCRMLADHGVDVSCPEPGRWVVPPGPVAAHDTTIAPDLTNAAVFLAAAMIAGGSVEVLDWPAATTQPGGIFLDVAAQMGARIERGEGWVRVSSQDLVGTDVDLHAASELTPVVAALAALARGRTTITGVAHIRGHETDRIAALAEDLSAIGVAVEERPDGLVIDGSPARALDPVLWACHADHRMAHAGALVGLAVEGMSLDDIACTAKTMPDFPTIWSDLVAGRLGQDVSR